MSDYKIEIEIYEGKGGDLQKDGDTVIVPDIVREGICAWMYGGDGEQSYKVGRRFSYPEEASKLCPWLLDSLRGASGHCADLAGPAAPLRDVALSRAHLESADGPFRHPHRPQARDDGLYEPWKSGLPVDGCRRQPSVQIRTWADRAPGAQTRGGARTEGE